MAKKQKSTGGATAAVRALEEAGIEFSQLSYEHEDGERNFGLEAAAKLGRSQGQVFKTLMICHERDFAVCVVPVAGKLSLKNAASVLGWKSAKMADPALAQKRTGYVVGGISPLGQKISHPTLVDETALIFDTVLVSGGKRGLDLELSAQDLVQLTGGKFADIAVG